LISPIELKRKLIHFLNLIIPFTYLTIFPDRMNMTIVMIIVAVIFLALDLARMRNGFVMAIFRKLFNPLMRKHELEGKLTGATWVVLVSIPMIYFYPKNIAVLSLIFMSLGDGAAAIVGQAYGRIKIGSKTLEGTLGCFTVGMVVSLFLNLLPLSVSFTGALSAAIFEVLPLNIDDNILIPIGSGTAMYIVSVWIT